jgi:hypothetical protein
MPKHITLGLFISLIQHALSPSLFLATIIVAFLIMMSGSDSHYLKYNAVTGFFLQDDPKTDSSEFDYVRSPNLQGHLNNNLYSVDIGFRPDRPRL